MRVLELREKHETRLVAIEDGDSPIEKMGAVYTAALGVVRERLADGYWYDGDPENQWEDRARLIVEAGDGKAAWAFLCERDDHQYEGVEIKTVR